MAVNNSINSFSLTAGLMTANGTGTISTVAPTNHAVQIGNASSTLNSVAVGTNGQILVAATTADPTFVTPTVGTGLSLTTNATTLSYGLTIPVVVSSGGTGATSLTAHSLLVGEGTSAVVALGAATNGQLPIGSTGADPVLATLSAGTGVSITNGAGSITINAVGSGVTWNDISGTSASMAVNNGYIADNAGLVTLTLPTTAVVGSILYVTGKGAGGWKIAQNASQLINLGTSTTTTGTGGSLASTNTFDSVMLVCITANNNWNVLNVQGNITVV
jgi:hypothetical protein